MSRVFPTRASSRSVALLHGSQQLLLLFRGVADVVVAQAAADGEFDSGQRGAKVMGHGAEDGRAHRVVFSGEAQHLPTADDQLLAFELGRQMDAEGPEEAPVTCWQDPSVEDQSGGGIDLLDVVTRGGITAIALGSSRDLSGRGQQPPRPATGRASGAVPGLGVAAEQGGAADLENTQRLLQQSLNGILRTGGAARQVTQRRCLGTGPRSLLGSGGPKGRRRRRRPPRRPRTPAGRGSSADH